VTEYDWAGLSKEMMEKVLEALQASCGLLRHLATSAAGVATPHTSALQAVAPGVRW